jgi:C4-dicarboxylate-binding protein DctP
MKKGKVFSLMALSTILAASVVGCGRPAAQQEPAKNTGNTNQAASSGSSDHMVLKFSHVVGEETPKHKAALKFAELVKQKSNGRIEIQVFPNSTLYGDKDEMQALQNGQVNFIAPSTSKIKNVPEWQVFDMPYIFRDEAHYTKVMEGPVGEKLYKLLEPQKMRGLAMWAAGMRHVSDVKQEIVKPEDLKGLKIRIQPGKVYEDMFKAPGAVPTAMAFGEVYQALESKTIDAQENAYSNIYSSKFYEVTPYLTETGHSLLSYVVLTNSDWWNGLKEEDRKILSEAMKEATAFGLSETDKLNDEAKAKIKATGKVKIRELSAGEKKVWEGFYKPVFDKFAKEQKIESLVEEIKSTK